MTVEPPKADPILKPETVTPNPYSQQVVDIMEVRSCSKPAAEQYIDTVGREQAAREIKARWSPHQ